MRPHIKICGVTDLAQAKALLALGVDYIGLIFYPQSPRSVTITQAAAFAELADHIVPVVVNQSAGEIQDILAVTQAKQLQLHGGPVDVPQGINKIITLSFKNKPLPTLAELTELYQYQPEHDTLLFDSIHLIKNPLATIQTYQPCRFFIAGRIQPQHIKSLIQDFHPNGIDMASMVESSPGIKDMQLVKQALKELSACH